MEKDFEYIDRIERYINGRMTDAEVASFEAEMQTNEALMDEVELFQDLMLGAEVYEDRELKKTIEQVHAKLVEDNFFTTIAAGTTPIKAATTFRKEAKQVTMDTSKKSRRGFLMGIAVSLALLVAAGLYLMQPASSVTDLKTAFAKYYHPDTTQIKGILDKLEAMGMATELNGQKDSLATALSFYETFEFNKSSTSLSGYLAAYPEDKVAQLYLGLSAIQTGDYAKGVATLQPLAIDTTFPQREMAMWYSALGATQLNDRSGNALAKDLVDKLCAMDSEYKEVACNYAKFFL